MVRVKCSVVRGRKRGKEGSERGKGGKKGKTLFYIKKMGKRVNIYMKFLVIGTNYFIQYFTWEVIIFLLYIMILTTDVTQILLMHIQYSGNNDVNLMRNEFFPRSTVLTSFFYI